MAKSKKVTSVKKTDAKPLVKKTVEKKSAPVAAKQTPVVKKIDEKKPAVASAATKPTPAPATVTKEQKATTTVAKTQKTLAIKTQKNEFAQANVQEKVTLNNKESILAIVCFFYGIFVLVLHVDDSFLKGWDHTFKYFTNLTSIITALWMVLFGLAAFTKCHKLAKIVKNKNLFLSIFMMCLLTFVTVLIWLFPFWKGEYLSQGISGLCFYTHFINHLVMIFVFFSVKFVGKWNLKTNLFTTIFPLVYFAIMLFLHYAFGIEPPYNFINPDWYVNDIASGNVVVGYGILIAVVIVLINVFYFSSVGLMKLQNRVGALFSKEKQNRI